MKITVKNLGVLKQAEFTLGDLTIVCGCNNTGKTYATYALFGFLLTWRQILEIKISRDKIEQLLTEGVMRIELQEYVNNSKRIIAQSCLAYTQQLPKIFASHADRFKDTKFQVSLDISTEFCRTQFKRITGSANIELFSLIKNKESTELVVTLLVEKDQIKIPGDMLKYVIADSIKDIIFSPFLPRPFIASAERTGAAIFRKELNFARNRLLEELGQGANEIDPLRLLLKDYQDYPLPIKRNVEFTRQLESLVTKNSFIAEHHPAILADFADIIGGEYTVTGKDELYYLPKGKSKQFRLSMVESSSAVRSLLDLGFYLRHEAQMGDLLMVDEPELNLHPENQRRVARLLARLVNLGIKIFITTHSDYIIKELNTLIMLNHDKPYLRQIAQEEGYRQEELISAQQIKVYIAEEASRTIEGKTGKSRKTKCHTLTPADIDPEMGIEARSFDTTIETMNRIQEAIVWGGE
ncbi:ATP-binding protein [Laspinema sp. D1]|uniref:ATP-binding protein n=1 Tax=Laspinema palackyanum D2a TaxID=2953684 RepID=A0ABT2MU77_9CYAN|nr:ATP-binding protein [Laspinema sp. D2a]